MSANNFHSHSINDPGHVHSGSTYNSTGSGLAGGTGGVFGQMGGAVTGISVNGADINHTHSVSGSTGGISTNHNHAISGMSDANASAANWTPRYLDFILCSRDAA
jgi:hypothetical protein